MTVKQIPVSSPRTDSQTRKPSAGKVLVVDDNPAVAGGLSMLLEVLGWQVSTATTGVEALEMIRSRRPDLVLLDISLPVMDGYEIARRLRTEHGDRVPLLVALSGKEPESADHGFDSYLIKPIDMNRLQTLLALATVS